MITLYIRPRKLIFREFRSKKIRQQQRAKGFFIRIAPRIQVTVMLSNSFWLQVQILLKFRTRISYTKHSRYFLQESKNKTSPMKSYANKTYFQWCHAAQTKLMTLNYSNSQFQKFSIIIYTIFVCIQFYINLCTILVSAAYNQRNLINAILNMSRYEWK